ncbi:MULTISPECIES: hypothetical protein [Candidatus Ichthyocystis]|uniref:hypothetical protein n=2 Tax=Burkholderiales genera incertae sedis TaxID=224471 RepID=UPI000B82CB73|nr:MULTISPECIES: hypothetical protein [Ichthyocystis]
MKRKLGSASSHEKDNYGQGGADERTQQLGALALEQSTDSSGVGGFILTSHLAQSLGMRPGDVIFRSMFYGTPQATLVSSLAAQLLEKHEVLVSRASGEGTSSATQSSNSYHDSSLMAANERMIRALLDSIEAPRFHSIEASQLQVAPTVVVEVGDTTHWQAPGPSAPEAAQVTDAIYWQEPGPSAPEAEQVADAIYWQEPGQSRIEPDEGFMLAPCLAQSLGMQPGQTLRKGMFHGTPQSAVVSGIVSQFSEIRGDLLRNQELKRAGLIPEGTYIDCEDNDSLIATNEELILALMSSIEAPSSTTEPAVVTEDVGISHEQAPSAPVQSKIGPDEGFMLAPYLAQSLGMQPGQILRKGMFYGSSQSSLVLEMISQLSAIQEDLLRNHELGRTDATAQGGIGLTLEDTDSLIETNRELLQALIASIEMPSVTAPTTVEESETESEEEEKSLAELEEARSRRLARSEARIKMMEQEKREELRKKGEVAAAKRREREIGAAISAATRRESVLEIAKRKVEKGIESMGATGSLRSVKTDMAKELRMVKATELELSRVVAEPRLEELQEMEKELDEARRRFKELEQAGARKAAAEIECLRIKEARVRGSLKTAIEREVKIKDLEKELEATVKKELNLEKTGANKEELDKVRKREVKIEMDLAELKVKIASTGRSTDIELELRELIEGRVTVEATIDRERRGIEMNRLKREAKTELGNRELELMLRLEGLRARVRELELELRLWLGKMILKKIEIEKRMLSLVSEITEMAAREAGKRK